MTCRKEFDTCRYYRLVRPQALLVKQSGRFAAAGDDPAQKYTGEVPMIPRAKRLLRPAVAILDTNLVVTSALTSADVSLTSGSRSPDETDGAAGSVTHSIFVRFTSNFVHLHSLPPLQERVMSRLSLINIFSPKIPT